MANATATATKRPRKTATAKAQADLDAATKTRDLAKKKLDKLQEGVAPAQAAFDAAERRVTYLSQNPDLPQPETDAPESVNEADADGGTPAST